MILTHKLLVLVPLLSMAVGFLVLAPPDDSLLRDIKVIESSPGIELHLSQYKAVLAKDYAGYKGHCYRVLSYAAHILGTDKHRDVLEAAIVYHDIGLWTDSKLAYLEPSVRRARENLAGEYDYEELQLVEDIISNHHKISPFQGSHAEAVNAVRRADWIDATMGFVRQGMPRQHIQKVMDGIPEAGFHATLAAFLPRLHGWNIPLAVWELAKIFRL
ncbi:hypothetical protein T484DRAFT_1932510 [Baffinella frigidus]|nr:hypothetical protein T484DRAFT_1932510 [Cryptophyta sp. CCMP2293]